ncbi:AAA family ATPase [Desulfonatronum thiodismutans]|uniref:AAA family ATPase n=1 Tax=Desulfonatronum thiodismutans TaxID=159290 RepID=UPI00068B2DCC|nr:AAA family ATPase [Desulfonatronum thiodismutans]
MNYFELLGLTREPFSNSPDPVFFFKSHNHSSCLHRLEIAVRLRRGLNVCLGRIGLGKSTLCRTLIQRLSQDKTIVPHLILDPSFSTPRELLTTLYNRFLRTSPPTEATHREIMEGLQQHLFLEAQENQKILVLIIDEGQKLVPECLEVIRELLNYETNDAKLLQVIIFAQEEFDIVLAEVPNFQDRINEFCRLMPLNFWDTRAMIRHRLSLAGTSRELFTWPAYWALYRASRGTPRKIMHLGHKALMALIVNNQAKADRNVVLSCARPLGWDENRRPPGLLLLVSAVLFAGFFGIPGRLHMDIISEPALPEGSETVIAPSEFRRPIPLEFRMDAEPEEPESLPENMSDVLENEKFPAEEQVASNSTHVRGNANSDKSQAVELERFFTGSRFYVQVGAFLQQSLAEKVMLAVRTRHESAGMAHVIYKGQHWNIVYIDHFDTSDKAIQKALEILRDEDIKTSVVEAEGQNYRFVWE